MTSYFVLILLFLLNGIQQGYAQDTAWPEDGIVQEDYFEGDVERERQVERALRQKEAGMAQERVEQIERQILEEQKREQKQERRDQAAARKEMLKERRLLER